MRRGLDKRGQASEIIEHNMGVALAIALALAVLFAIGYFVIRNFGGLG